MVFLQRVLNVFMTLSLLSSTGATEERVPWFSLWGDVANFNACSHWRLKSQVSFPALQEFTVCLDLKFENPSPLFWTAFMYRHPKIQHAELGLGGKWGQLVIWLFGMEWTTKQINLSVSQWYSLCLTWTHTKDRPVLYIDGEPETIKPGMTPLVTSSCCILAPYGTLTLGASHSLVNGRIKIIPSTLMMGKLSRFRLWRRERSKQEVTSLKCTEGDLIKWMRDDWDTRVCPPLADTSLLCEWSFYEVRLMFAILGYGVNNTELYTVRDMAHHWLRTVLPKTVYLHRVSVFEVSRSSSEDSFEGKSHEDGQVWWAPPTKRFNCLAHVNVIPSMDVAAVQHEIHTNLSELYAHPSGLLQLLADAESIRTTAIESFTAGTITPGDVATTPLTTTTLKATATTGTATSASTSVSTAPTSSASHTSVSNLYFEVQVNVSITGDDDTQQILSSWLNCSLPDDKMMLLDLQLLPKALRRRHNLQPNVSATAAVRSVYRVSRERCVFQVQVMTSHSDTQQMEELIRDLLLTPYNNGSISIATQDIQISQILVVNCNAQTHQTRKGLFRWPTTVGGKNATRPCPKNPNHYASRHCKLCISTHWLAPDLEACSLVVETIPDLDHVKVTAENALDVVEMIKDLLSDHAMLNYQELVTVLNKLKDIVNISMVTAKLGQALINIISEILESDSNLLPFTNTILNITEAVGDRMVGYEGSSTLIAPALAIAVVDVAPGQFDSLTFGVSSDHEGTNPEIFINRYPFNGTVAFISLPSILQHSFPQSSCNQTPPRVMFQFYAIPMLFRGSQKGQSLNSFVVSASVTNASSPIKDLHENVQIMLHHLTPNTLNEDEQCVYWNFNKNNGKGGWDDYGCRKYNSSSEYTTCLCDHLTHFGVLLDVSRSQVDPANEQILTIITYAGCGVSSLFLGVTVLTYTVFEKLRRDYPSQILINLSLALMGLNLVFLVNSWLSSWGLYGLCLVVASTLHYFLLASFTWMGLEAVNMYFALVKVFNVYVPSYILKFCVLGWGTPLVICMLVLIVNKDAYGSHLYTDAQSSLEPLNNSEDFCWLQDDVTFYVSVVAYALLIFLFNIAVFVVVLIQIRHIQANSPAGTRSGLMHDLKGVASLTLLLGLTWTVGFFTWGPARIFLLYIFSGLNSLQGLFIFLFHCLMKENVRKEWRVHLCLGRFRLDEYSEWSNSASVGVAAKPRQILPRASVPSVRSVKSSSTDSTSASSNSSQRDSFCKRPNLGENSHSDALNCLASLNPGHSRRRRSPAQWIYPEKHLRKRISGFPRHPAGGISCWASKYKDNADECIAHMNIKT